MNALQLTSKLKSYIIGQLDIMSETSPAICFVKPIATRVIDKNFNKIISTLDLIADDQGNIDVQGILTETIDNLVNTKPFNIKTSFIGNIEVGGGSVKINIPFTEKKLILGTSDLENLKAILIPKE